MACLFCFLGWPVVGLEAEDPARKEMRIMVRYSASTNPSTTEQKYGLKFLKDIPGTRVRVYLLSGPESPAVVIQKLRQESGVELVEEDFLQEKQ